MLWCQGRSARRSTIIEALWEEQEPGRTDEYLNKAAMRLRHILQVTDSPDLFQTSKNRTTYLLADQSRLWVDAQAAQEYMREAEQVGRTSRQGLVFLQEAQRYVERGSFLEDESDWWTHGKRGVLEAAALTLAQGQPKAALHAFESYQGHLPLDAVPQRNVLEILNQQSRATILSQQLEMYAQYLRAGLEGALTLQSQKRLTEVITIFQQEMPRSWQKAAGIARIVERYPLLLEAI